MTYTGTWKTAAVAEGEHALYIRARDFTGNARTVRVTVTVAHAAGVPQEDRVPEPAKGEELDLSWNDTWALDLGESHTSPRG